MSTRMREDVDELVAATKHISDNGPSQTDRTNRAETSKSPSCQKLFVRSHLRPFLACVKHRFLICLFWTRAQKSPFCLSAPSLKLVQDALASTNYVLVHHLREIWTQKSVLYWLLPLVQNTPIYYSQSLLWCKLEWLALDNVGTSGGSSGPRNWSEGEWRISKATSKWDFWETLTCLTVLLNPFHNLWFEEP